MAFNWEVFRNTMIGMYHGELGRPSPLTGKHGENYSNQCALRHSNAVIQAGYEIDHEEARTYSPSGFFSYAGECVGAGANGRQLARGAANWWNYLDGSSGLLADKYVYNFDLAPASISHRNKVPFITMRENVLGNASYRVSWLSEGDDAGEPARFSAIDLQDIVDELSDDPTERAEELLNEYADLARTNSEFVRGYDKLPSYIVGEGVWPRLIRMYLTGAIKGYGFVYYYDENNRNDRGFHIDGYDIPYFLAGHHSTPWLGSDYANHRKVTKIIAGEL